MPSLQSRVILVTGSTDGHGHQLARDLAAGGATVLLHGRDAARGEALRRTIAQETGNDRLALYNADFAALEQVRRLADAILADHQRRCLQVSGARAVCHVA